jgi:outer membrane protein
MGAFKDSFLAAPLFYLVVLGIIIAGSSIQAQNTLTSDDAVAIALKNNFGILIAGKAVAIARVNNAAGNAGMLPSLSLTGAGTLAQNTIDQKLSSGAATQSYNEKSNTLNAGVELNWILFDGGKMFVTKRKLNEIESLNQVQFKDKVQKSIYAVVAAYYDIVRQKQELLLLNEIISYNTDRVTILKTGFTSGLSPKTNYLQAQIDLNVTTENAINQKTIIGEAKRTLNQLLSMEPTFNYNVQDSIPLDYTPDSSRINWKLFENNTDIISLQKQVNIARFALSEYRTLRYPRITLNAGYDLVRIDNSAGSPLYNLKYGPSVGASLVLPLYQAGTVSRQIASAEIQIESSKYFLEDAKNQAVMQAQNAIESYNNQRQMLIIEKESSGLAKENLDISMQRLRLGQSTSLELRQAQESYEQARTRLINIQYNLKIAETKLKQLLAEL